MKKIISSLCLAFAMACCFSCADISVKEMHVIDENYTDGYLKVALGESYRVGLFVEPMSAYEHLTWSSSNPEVASAEMGYITGRSEGIATITVKSVNGKKLTIMVQVVKAKVTSWRYSSNFAVVPGSSKEMEVSILEPEGASHANLIAEITNDPKSYFSVWTSEHGFEIGCSSDAPADGSYTARLVLSNVDKSKSTTTNLQALYVAPVSVSIYPANIDELMVGMHDQITAYVKPDNASNQDVAWSVEPSGIVNLQPEGRECKVSGIEPGTAVITATTIDGGKQASCTVKVVKAYAKTLSARFYPNDPMCVGGQTEKETQREISVSVNPSIIVPEIINLTPEIFDLDGNFVRNPKKAGQGAVKVVAGDKEVTITIPVLSSASTLSLGVADYVRTENFSSIYNYVSKSSLDVLPLMYTSLYVLYGGAPVDGALEKMIGDAYGMGEIKTSFSGNDFTTYPEGLGLYPYAKAPATTGKSTTVTVNWGSKSATCRLTTKITSITLLEGGEPIQTISPGGTFTLQRSRAVTNVSQYSWTSKSYGFAINAGSSYVARDSMRSAVCTEWTENYGYVCKQDVSFINSIGAINFRPDTPLQTYQFNLVKLPDVTFNIKLTN